VTDLDPELAETIRASVDKRITAQIAAARKLIDQKRMTRDSFARSRAAGLHHRLAAREARLRLAANHTKEDQ
jgi:hypothetical protein